ncbi:MAG: DUF4831 family protein [Bacteroidaceae bacterium]
MKKTIIFAGLLLSVGCFAQTNVANYQPGSNQNGVTYFLPKTVVEIEVVATKTTYTPGEFCKYADRYLRLTGISDIADEYWEIGSITAKTTGVPDLESVFTVELKDKTVAPLMGLTKEGIIESINIESEKKSIPAIPLTPAMKSKLNPRDFMTEEILMASSSAKMAELVAKEIYNIRESKNAILRGQADNMPKDGESLKLMMAKMEEQEQAMLSLFTGTKEQETKTFTIPLVPKTDITKEIVFRFSKKLGIVAKDDLVGAPIYLSLTDLKTVPLMDVKAKKNKKNPEGIVYNVPGKAKVSIFDSQNIYFDGELLVTQFGNQETLTDNLFNKKVTTTVRFSPETGGILKIGRE